MFSFQNYYLNTYCYSNYVVLDGGQMVLFVSPNETSNPV
jgi:hypothetical protein